MMVARFLNALPLWMDRCFNTSIVESGVMPGSVSPLRRCRTLDPGTIPLNGM